MEVHWHVVGHSNLLAREGSFMDVSRVTITWTNADGDWLQNHVAGITRFREELDGDILTVTETHAWMPERLRSAEGITAAFDRGLIKFQFVIDLNDLEDPDDDVLISAETSFLAGPHPEAESGFVLFCEVVTEVLG